MRKPVDPIVDYLFRYADSINISVADLAKRSGIHQSRLYNWRTGETAPTLANLRRLCQALSVTLAIVDR